MANSEKTFADRLERGKQLKQALDLIPGYHPKDITISVDGYRELLLNMENTNLAIGSLQSQLTTEIGERKNITAGNQGLKVITSRIVNYCKSSNELKPYLNSILLVSKKILNTRTASAKVQGAVGNPVEEKEKRNSGEQSFGDFEKLANDLLQAIRNTANYSPNNQEISINGFQSLVDTFRALNISIADKRSQFTNLLWERQNLYEGENGLRDRMKRIKSNIAAEFGKNSKEYEAVSGFKY